MIIDAHTHIHQDSKGFGEQYDANLKNLLESLDKAGACHAVVLPINPAISNFFVSRLCKAYPEKLTGFASAMPDGKKSADALLKSMKRLGLKGIKLHPKYQGFSLGEKKVRQFFMEIDNRAEVPIVLDCWLSEKDEPRLADEVVELVSANDFKRLKLILAHAGGFSYAKIVPLAQRKNIYLDLSYSLMTFQRFQREDCISGLMNMLRMISPDKIIFGSDFPECNIKESAELLKNLLKRYGFSDDEAQLIFAKNIKRILGNKEL